MTVEIPDNKLLKILKEVQYMCNEYFAQEDPAPGIGKTENQFFWFEDLNSILYEQFEHKIKDIFSDAINSCFLKVQESFGVTSGDEPIDSKINTLRIELAEECARVVMFQMR